MKTIAVWVLVLSTIAFGIWIGAKSVAGIVNGLICPCSQVPEKIATHETHQIAWICFYKTDAAEKMINGIASTASDGYARVKFDPELPAVPVCLANDLDRPVILSLTETSKNLLVRVWSVAEVKK